MKKRYRLIRSASLGISGLSAVGMILGAIEKTETIPNYKKTAEDISYEETLEELENREEIVFENQELLEYIKSVTTLEEINKETLSSVQSLMIDRELSNQNFSDLKYFPNLSSLSILNNDIDLDDLYYNSKLTVLTITDGTIKNTASIPNSVTKLELTGVTITDGHLIIPYFTTNTTIKNCTFEDLYFENPEILEYFELKGNTILDLAQFTNNTKLKRLSIEKCYNVQNCQVLKNIDSLEEVVLDETAVCWMDIDTLNNIPYQCYIPGPDLMLRVATLNEIKNEIIPDERIENAEKMELILTYVKENIRIYKNTGWDIDSDILFRTSPSENFSLRSSKEGQITMAIFCHETSSNYLVAALARMAGIDVTIEKEGEQRVYINAEGIKVDVSRYVKGTNLLNTQTREGKEQTSSTEENYSVGPLSLYYEKGYRININNLTEDKRNLLIKYGCAGLLSLLVSASAASADRKRFDAFLSAIDDTIWDVKDKVAIKSLEELKKEINTEYEDLAAEVTEEINLIIPKLKHKWSKAGIEENLAERYKANATTRAEIKDKAALESQNFAEFIKKVTSINEQNKMRGEITQYTTSKQPEPISLPSFQLDKIQEKWEKVKEQEALAREEIRQQTERATNFFAGQLAYHTLNEREYLTTKRVKNSFKNNSLINKMVQDTNAVGIPIQPPKTTIVSEKPNRPFLFENKTQKKNQQIMEQMERRAATKIIAARINPSAQIVEQVTGVNFVLLGAAENKEKLEEITQVVVAEKALPMVIRPNEVEAIMEKAKEQASISPIVEVSAKRNQNKQEQVAALNVSNGNNAGKKVTMLIPGVILPNGIKTVGTNKENSLLLDSKEKEEIKKEIEKITKSDVTEKALLLPRVIRPDEIEAIREKAKEQAMRKKEVLVKPKEQAVVQTEEKQGQDFSKIKLGKEKSYLEYERAITKEFIKPLYEQTKAKIEEQVRIKARLARKARYEARKKKLMQPTMSMQDVLTSVKANISILKENQTDKIEQLQKETKAKECFLPPMVILPNEIESIKAEAKRQAEQNISLRVETQAKEVEKALPALPMIPTRRAKESIKNHFGWGIDKTKEIVEMTQVAVAGKALPMVIPVDEIEALMAKAKEQAMRNIEEQEVAKKRLIEEQEAYYGKLNDKLEESYKDLFQSIRGLRKVRVDLWNLNYKFRKLPEKLLKIKEDMEATSKKQEAERKKLPSTTGSNTAFPFVRMNQEIERRITSERKYTELGIKTQTVMLNFEKNLHFLDLTCKKAEQALAKNAQLEVVEGIPVENSQGITMSKDVMQGIQFLLQFAMALKSPTDVVVDATQQPETVVTNEQSKETILEEKPTDVVAVLEDKISSSTTNLIRGRNATELLKSLEIKIPSKENDSPVKKTAASLEQSNNPLKEEINTRKEVASSNQEIITRESLPISKEDPLEEIKRLRQMQEENKKKYLERKAALSHVETAKEMSDSLKTEETKEEKQLDKEKVDEWQILRQRQEKNKREYEYLLKRENLAGKIERPQEVLEISSQKEVEQTKSLETTQEINASDEDKLKEIAQMTESIKKIMEELRRQKMLQEKITDEIQPQEQPQVFTLKRMGSM